MIFEELRAEWVRTLGVERVRAIEADLRVVVPADGFRVDVAGWFG